MKRRVIMWSIRHKARKILTSSAAILNCVLSTEGWFSALKREVEESRSREELKPGNLERIGLPDFLIF